MSSTRILVVAPSWVGDAILSEPLIARLRAEEGAPEVDVLSPAWCAAVYARMRGVARVYESTIAHGGVDLPQRRSLARTLAERGHARAIVLPNSWKSALIPWLAGIRQRTGYVGEMRYGLVNDARRLDRRATSRLVDRYAALATPRGVAVPPASAPVLVPDVANREAARAALKLDTDARIAILCPGAEFGPAKRWPPEHYAALAQRFVRDGCAVWIVGSPKDKSIAEAILSAAGESAQAMRNLAGRTDLGTAVDLVSLASVVVSNDSGLMHVAAAVGVPLVALFGSSSPVYTPPLSPRAQIARIDIECSPCFKRECPLGHFRCMRELAVETVYDLSRSALPHDGTRHAIPDRP